MNRELSNATHTISVGNILESNFKTLLEKKYKNSKKIILVDENTQRYCLEYLITSFEALHDAEVMAIPAGEENKTLEICAGIWSAFSEYNVNRNDVLINLGGGMVTDLGGFVASVFKRGIDFINIPTSLLAIVDASSGGKTGIDFEEFKNQLGVFADPQLVVCDPIFLKTLPEEEFISGKAEMFKHGIISSKAHWNKVKACTMDTISAELIFDSLKVKYDIVTIDPKEKNVRKKLNVGHTIGHAIESFLLPRNKQPHGVCVAWGTVVEAQLAFDSNQLEESEFHEIKATISQHFPTIPIQKNDFEPILGLMQNDKKNTSNNINFNLIKAIGDVEIDASFTEDEILSALTKTFVA